VNFFKSKSYIYKNQYNYLTLKGLRVKIMDISFVKGNITVKINIPNSALTALNLLKINGFDGYIVGGCVRDSLLKKIPQDWDICTNALPFEIIKTFSEFKVIETGLKHGTVTVIIEKAPLEITTFRVDGEYSDSRHPDEVSFVSNIKDDLSRRDFAVNAMAYSDKTGIIDYFGGRNDLENKQIKCVGEPDVRFKEDSLRILRAIRFSSTLGFEIEAETSNSIFKNKELLNNISVERIAVELNKLLLGVNVYKVLEKYRDIIAVFIPEMRATFDFEQHNKHHSLTVYNHIIKSVEAVPADLILRLAMLFHDIGKPQCFTLDTTDTGHFKGHQKPSAMMAEVILKRLKYDNDTIKLVTSLILEHDNRYPPNSHAVKRFMQKYDYDFLKLQTKVRRADCTAQSMYLRADKLKEIDDIEEVAKEIVKENECFKLENLAINGDDLIALGIPKGKEIGEVLSKILSLVIDAEIKNEKQVLMEKVKELI